MRGGEEASTSRTLSLDARPRQGLEGAPMRLPTPTFDSTAAFRISSLDRVE